MANHAAPQQASPRRVDTDQPTLAAPLKFQDEDWVVRTQRAKAAWNQGRELRKGKPAGFTRRRTSWS